MIDATKMEHIARLAHIALQPHEKEELQKSLEKVFHWVSQLESLSLQTIPSLTGEPTPMRSDEEIIKATPQDILANAPDSQDQFFVVPRILE